MKASEQYIKIGDLVSWRNTNELGIVLDKRRSILKDTEDVLVRFIQSTSNTQGANWYDSKYLVKMEQSLQYQ